MSDEKKLDGELKEGAAAQGERELGVDAQAAGDPRGERLRASSAGDDKVLRMGTASIPRLITEFAIPSVVGMLINGSYAIIDSVFLGHAVGEIGLSAMTVANPIMIVFMAIAMLIGNSAGYTPWAYTCSAQSGYFRAYEVAASATMPNAPWAMWCP